MLDAVVGASPVSACAAYYLWSLALRTLLCATSFSYNFDEDMHGLIGLATPNHMVPSGQGQPHAGSS